MKGNTIKCIVTLLLFLVPFAIAHEEANAEKLDAVKMGIVSAGNAFLVKADAAITAAKEKELDIQNLQKQKDEFAAILARVLGMSSYEEVKGVQKEIHIISDNIRKEAKRINLASREVKRAIDDALKQKKEELQQFARNAADARKKALLQQYEKHLEQATAHLEKLKERDLSITEIENALKEYLTVKNELEKALDLGSKDSFQEAMNKLRNAWKKVQSAFEQGEKQRAVLSALETAEAVLKRHMFAADTLRKEGKDTAVLDKAITELKQRVEDAAKAADNNNLAGAKGLLKEAHLVFGRVKTAASVVNREKAREHAEKKIERAVEHLDKTKEQLEKQKEKLEEQQKKLTEKLEKMKNEKGDGQ